MNTTRTQFTKQFASAVVLLLAALPMLVGAQGTIASGGGTDNPLATFIASVVKFMNDVLLPVILALGFLVFVWGVFLYFIKGGADDEAQSKGKSLMLYAIAGFVLILIFFGIVNLLANSIGLDSDGIDQQRIPGVEINTTS